MTFVFKDTHRDHHRVQNARSSTDDATHNSSTITLNLPQKRTRLDGKTLL